PAHVTHAIKRLAMQVVHLHRVGIDQDDAPHPGPDEVLQHRHAEPAGADHEHPRRREPCLARRPHLGKDQLARMAIAHTRSSHSRTRASGSGFSVMSVTTETRSAPAASASTPRSGVMPPMAHSGRSPTRRFHSVTRPSPCSCHFIFLRMVGYTGPRAT